MTAVPQQQAGQPATDRTAHEQEGNPTRIKCAELAGQLARCEDPARARALRDELIRTAMPMAVGIARSYRRRAESFEDLLQVACEGLVKAADRFDPEVGDDFVAFASPTVRGEVRRYFRDHGWSIRPPRSVQEQRVLVEQASEQLQHDLGRSPRISEIAAHLNMEPERVAECMLSHDCYRPDSLDAPVEADGSSVSSVVDVLGAPDAAMTQLEDLSLLRDALSVLDERLRTIVELRFFQEMTQEEIGKRVGVSQMQVSRLLTKALGLMRERALQAA